MFPTTESQTQTQIEPEPTCEADTRFVSVKNKNGLHARPAASIVRVGNKYPDVDLKIVNGDEVANAKSIMGVMMLAAGQGSNLKFVATGDPMRTKPLLDELEKLFASKFGED